MSVTNEHEQSSTTGGGGEAGPVVVVGVDGSPASSRALTFAAEEARMRGASLRVVEAWSFPVFTAGTYVPAGAYEDFPEETSAALESQVSEVLGEHPDLGVERLVGEGPAAQVILEACKGAELVVVGSRGRGGFSGLLLGSVSNQVAHHATCPVAIVRS